MLMITMELSRATSSRSFRRTSMAIANDDDNSDTQEQRSLYELNKLRHFLLTSDAEQRATRRKQQEFYIRELVNCE